MRIAAKSGRSAAFGLVENLMRAIEEHQAQCMGTPRNPCGVDLQGLRKAAAIVAREATEEEKRELAEMIQGLGVV